MAFFAADGGVGKFCLGECKHSITFLSIPLTSTDFILYNCSKMNF